MDGSGSAGVGLLRFDLNVRLSGGGSGAAADEAGSVIPLTRFTVCAAIDLVLRRLTLEVYTSGLLYCLRHANDGDARLETHESNVYARGKGRSLV